MASLTLSGHQSSNVGRAWTLRGKVDSSPPTFKGCENENCGVHVAIIMHGNGELAMQRGLPSMEIQPQVAGLLGMRSHLDAQHQLQSAR
jgi:hypothetical protein